MTNKKPIMTNRKVAPDGNYVTDTIKKGVRFFFVILPDCVPVLKNYFTYKRANSFTILVAIVKKNFAG